MERLPGGADARGTDYEFKMAALVALRLRRRGVRFQLFSNAAAAHPFDDLVVHMLSPAPALLLVQLKHQGAEKRLNQQAFITNKNFRLDKYFELCKRLHQWRAAENRAALSEDQRLLNATAPEDVWFVLYTPAAWAGDEACGAPAPFEDELHTRPHGQCVSFGERHAQACALIELCIWNLASSEDQTLYREKFLPNLRIFCSQSVVEDLDDLIQKELDQVFGKHFLDVKEELLKRFKDWAQNTRESNCVTESLSELWEALAAKLRRMARAAAGDGALIFREELCAELRGRLRHEQALHVRVRGAARGHRTAKIIQVLDGEVSSRWTLVGDQALRQIPRAALEAACGAGQVLALDVLEELEAAQALVAAIPSRVKVVAVTSDGDAWPLQNIRPLDWEELEDWKLNHLTLEAQEGMMEAIITFQGCAMPLRCLEPTWPSLRQDVDGALLSALARGRSAMGAGPPAPDDAHTHLPRTLEHPATLHPDVLRKLDPQTDHLVLSGFPTDFLQSLDKEIDEKDKTEEDEATDHRQGRNAEKEGKKRMVRENVKGGQPCSTHS